MATYPAVRLDLDHVAGFVMASANLALFRKAGGKQDAIRAIAYELAYDRALIILCLMVGIETGPERYDVPLVERERLHRAVVEAVPSLRDVVFTGQEMD